MIRITPKSINDKARVKFLGLLNKENPANKDITNKEFKILPQISK